MPRDTSKNTYNTDKKRYLDYIKNNGYYLLDIAGDFYAIEGLDETKRASFRHDVSFFWSVYRIKCLHNDKIRIQYINRFVSNEVLKFLGAVTAVVVGGLYLAGVICFPLDLILGALITAIAGLYLAHKIYQHSQGFFHKAEEARDYESDEDDQCYPSPNAAGGRAGGRRNNS